MKFLTKSKQVDPDKKQSKKLSKKQYEELGRIVASVYETGYLDAAKSYRMSFIKGMFRGLGSVVGATILVALLLWVLSLFNEIPLLGNIVDKVETSIEQTTP